MTSAPGTQDDAQTRAPDHSDDGMVAHRVASSARWRSPV